MFWNATTDVLRAAARGERMAFAICSVTCCAACLPLDDLSSYGAGQSAAAAEPPGPAVVMPDGGPASVPPAGVPLSSPGLAWPPTAPARPPARPACGATYAADSSADCATKPGVWRGKSTHRLRVAGLERSFIYYAPEQLAPDAPAPVLIFAHSFSLSAEELFQITGYDRLAEREQFLLIFANGQGAPPWNVGRRVCPSENGPIVSAPGDDQAFLDAVLEFVEADRALDRAHIFVSGFGVGGYFANEAGCLRSDVRGIAPHSAGSHDLDGCLPEPKPVILFHGAADSTVSVDCGIEARRRWAEHNGCGAEVDVVPVLGGACEYSRGCAPRGQVALCLFDELGLGWAGGVGQPGISDSAFAPAAGLTWEFFRRHAW